MPAPSINQSPRSIFLAAIESHPPESWPAFLDSACGNDAALRDQVQRLLDAHAKLTGFMDVPAAPTVPPQSVADSLIGQNIGRYRLLEQIGEGGMGVVYVAEQTEPVKRQVALKIIKPGLDSRQVIARFEAERQALALMDHAHIAKILDAGTIGEGARDSGLGSSDAERLPSAPSPQPPAPATGRPYFVMELVRGLPITDYCDQARLSVPDRLGLLITVCQAVQHAHQKGIIHRDLKPSNVLVTLADGQPVVKVIDFGVAKALNQQLTAQTIHTQFAQMIGTPLYMSPEQAELSALDIDTRSDVYSLGVLLYELLTGHTPFDADTLKQAGFDEMRRIIREDEPPRPSARLSTLGNPASSTVSERRGLDQRRLVQHLRGELDWIVMKALEKDRTRRYESASALAADLMHYLNGEPVQAAPPSQVYLLAKFIQRHRAWVIAASLVVATFIAGLSGTLYGLVRARAERDAARTAAANADNSAKAAQAAADFFIVGVLGAASPEESPVGNPITLKEALDRAAARIETDFEGRTRIEWLVRFEVGRSYANLGEYPSAQHHLEQALTLAQRDFGSEGDETFQTIHLLAQVYGMRGDLEREEQMLLDLARAEERRYGTAHKNSLDLIISLIDVHVARDHFSAAQALIEKALGAAGRMDNVELEVARLKRHRGHCYLGEGDYPQAEACFQQALELAREKIGDENPEILSFMSSLATVYTLQHKLSEAESLLLSTVEISRRVVGNEHPQTLDATRVLADVYEEQAKFDQAEPLREFGWEACRRTFGDNHTLTIEAQFRLADLRQGQGKLQEAEDLLVSAVETARKELPLNRRLLALMVNSLALLLRERLKLPEAERLAREAVASFTEILGSEHPLTLTARNNLALVLDDRGQHAEAKEILEQILEVERRTLGEEHGSTLFTMNNLARVYENLEQLEKALQLHERGIELRRRVFGPEHPSTFTSAVNLGLLYSKLGEFQKAEPLIQEALVALRQTLGEDHPKTLATMESLVQLYSEQRQWDLAKPIARARLAGATAREGDDSLESGNALSSLGLVLLGNREFAEAEAICRKCLAIRSTKIPDDWRRFSAETLLGASLLGQDKLDEAEMLLISGYNGLIQRQSKMPSIAMARISEARDRLVQLYEAKGDLAEADKWRAQPPFRPDSRQ